MALTVKDRVKESSTTTGTADFVLGGAAAGFQTFAVIGNTNTTYYAAVDQATGDWEVGIGTYSSTGPTLTRDTVFESSNSGSKVNFAAGSKDVFCTYPAERSVYLDAAGSAVTTLDIGTLGASTANITTANITAGTISTTPSSANDITNKSYVDTLAASGIHFHQPVRVESPINLNATYNNGTSGVGATLTNAGTQVALEVDGVAVAVNDRVLVYEQITQTQNGIYVVTDVGSGSTNWVLTRSSDADTYVINSAAGLSEGSTVFVQQGATGAGETYTCNTSGVITFGTTNITFAQISSAQIYSAGTGLTLSGTQFSITNTGTAGTYGAAATVPVITTNAQGQVTSVTPTAVAIAAAAVSGLAPSATTDTTNAANITSGTLPSARLSGSYTGITGVGTLAAGTWNGSTIAAAYGGTGQSSYTVGDILYADGSTSLAKLADVATGNALISGGVGTAPAWGKIGLQTHISGTLQVANGGTGATDAATARANLGAGTGNGSVTSVAAGSYLTGGTITTSGTLGVDATTTNTAGKVVARDGSGNFSAGTITANLTGNVTGNLTGNVTGNVTGTASGNLPLSGGDMTGRIRMGTFSASTTNTGEAWIGRASDRATGTMTVQLGNSADRVFEVVDNAWSTVIFSAGMNSFTYKGSAILHAGNYNSYAPTLTGGGASGTWGINITGNSATVGGRTPSATSGVANRVVLADSSGYIFNNYFNSSDNTQSSGVSAVMVKAGDNYYRSGTAAAVASFISGQSMNISGSSTTLASGQSNWVGTGVLGNVVGLMSWRNYGNSHVIFDASASTSPSGGTVNNTNPQNAWGGTYPTLMGWNGANTYGVRVDSARTADQLNGYAASTYIGKFGNTYYQADNWIQFNTSAGLYWPSYNSAEWTANTASSYGNFRMVGSRNGYDGIYSSYSAVNGMMYDSGGNGGVYREANGRWYFYYNLSNACMGIGSAATTAGYVLQANGSFYATSAILAAGNITAYSDERLKKDWATLPADFIERLATVKSGTYTRIDSDKRQAGSSAQDWQKLLPEVVQEETDDAKTLSLAYGNAALVSAIELAKRVVEQDARIAALEALVAKLR